MKIASFFLLVGTVVGSTEAFLPSSRIAERKDDVFSAALHMKPKPKQQDHASDVRLYQSSTSFGAPSATTSSSSQRRVLYAPVSPASTSSTTANTFPKSIPKPSPLVQALASSTLFILSDVLIKQVFKARGITFPSSLAGCCAMAATLLVNPYHASMYQVLAPGAKLLQKFLMVFLVPNLIVLPLCDGCGSVTEVS
jgi:hypothetical protein